MHRNNKLWLKNLKKKYPKSFKSVKVLELGSGTTTNDLVIRSFFKKCKYIGVDLVGEDNGVYGVDVIGKAGSTIFKRNYFDTLICFSMFEHDQTWRKSLSHNLEFLKPDGMIFISFGADGNRRHDPEPWAPVKYDVFLKFCQTKRIKIIDAFFEEERYGYDCAGAFNFIGQKKDKYNNIKEFEIESVKLVNSKSLVNRLKDILLYYAIRSRRNIYKIIPLKNKYFYNQ